MCWWARYPCSPIEAFPASSISSTRNRIWLLRKEWGRWGPSSMPTSKLAPFKNFCATSRTSLSSSCAIGPELEMMYSWMMPQKSQPTLAEATRSLMLDLMGYGESFPSTKNSDEIDEHDSQRRQSYSSAGETRLGSAVATAALSNMFCISASSLRQLELPLEANRDCNCHPQRRAAFAWTEVDSSLSAWRPSSHLKELLVE